MNGDVSWMVTQSLIEQFGGEEKAELLQHLTPKLQHQIKSLEPTFQFQKSPKSIDEILYSVHYSWMISLLEPFTAQDQLIFIASLSGEQGEYLKKHFQLNEPTPSLHPILEHYVHEILFQKLTGPEPFIPEEYLPSHPLNILSSVQRDGLLQMFTYLGLHDLSVDLKKVIQSNLIKKITQIIPSEEMEYIKKVQKRNNEVEFGPLHLEKWDGKIDSLRKILHGRGMNRFAKALFGCHSSLLWQISHKIDTKRFQFLSKLCVDIKNKRAKERLVHDILELIPKK